MIALLEQHRQKIADLCKQYGVERLEVFGSAARGEFDPSKSDVDFLVEFRHTDPLERGRAYLALLEALEHEFGRVDLVSKQALTNPYLLKNISQDLVTLYAA